MTWKNEMTEEQQVEHARRVAEWEADRDRKKAEREAEQSTREEERRLKAEVKRLTAEIAALEPERDKARTALLEATEERDQLREAASPEGQARRQADIAQHETELRQQLRDFDHRDAFAAMARRAGIKDKAIRAAWNELKATHGYKVEGDKANPMILGKALEALKGSHDFMFDLPPAAQAHVLNGNANGAPPKWTLEGFQNRFGQH